MLSSMWGYIIHSYLSQFLCDCYSSGLDLLCSPVLLGHVGEDLLLLGVLIQLLALLLQLLPLLLLLQGAQAGHAEEKQSSLLNWELNILTLWEPTASLACLSFSLSVRTLSCSALSARRFSWGSDRCCWIWQYFDDLAVLRGFSLFLI